HLVSVAARLEDPMTGHDDDKRVPADGLGDRPHRAGCAKPDCDLAIGHGLATRNVARDLIDPQVERGNPAGIKCDAGEVTYLAAKQRSDPFDRRFDTGVGACFAGLGIKLKKPPAGIDLAGFGELYADDTRLTPRDAATADRRIENGVRLPQHTFS